MGTTQYRWIACAIVLGAQAFTSSKVFANDGGAPGTAAAKCELAFKPGFEAPSSVRDVKELRRAAHQAIPKFDAYFRAISDRVLERKALVELAEVALIAEEHLLMMGPPGNAKSQLSDLVLGNMTDAAGEKSYFRIQMTPETTMSETHGPMDYKKLSDTGEYDRLHEQGMGAKRNIFVDEIFDARANAQRNILGLLAERSHAQGSHVIKAEIETVIGATNRYLSQVYEKAGDDGPKAVLDRFALVAFVPATFEQTASYVQVITRSKKPAGAIPELKFDDVEALRAIVPQVEISVPVAKALSLLSMRMKAETEALEAASLKAYADKIKNGEEPTVPYRATKYHSIRTVGKASAILRAFVVKDWVDKRGKRKLEATIQDLAQLMKFFTLNGPSEAFVKSEMARTSNQHERAQLMAILQEREIFERHYNKIVEEMDVATVTYALTDLAGSVGNAKTAAEKQAAAQTIIAAIAKVVSDKVSSDLQSELSGLDIGRDFVQNYLEGLLKGLVSVEEFLAMKRTVLEEIQRQKREIVEKAEAVRKAEQERVRLAEREAARKEAAEKAAADAAERRATELREAFTDSSRYKLAIEQNTDEPRNGQAVVGYDPVGEIVAVYNRLADSVRLYDTKTMPASGKVASKVIERVLGDEKVDGMEIGEIHFEATGKLVLIAENGKAAFKYDIETKEVESVSLSMKDVATSYDPTSKRTIIFDPSTLKLKTSSDSGTSSEQFKFVDTTTPQRNWDETTFKATIVGANLQLQVARNGRYAVLVSSDRTAVFKIDFEKKVVVPIGYEAARSASNSQENDRSLLHFYDTEMVVVDRSGEEPVVKKLKNSSGLRNQIGQGSTLVEGTNLLLASKGSGTGGWELVNGTDGNVLADVFVTAGLTGYSLRSYQEGYVLFGHLGGTWHTQILKRNKLAE